MTTIVRPRDVIGEKTIQTRAHSLCNGDWAGAAVKTALAERANSMG